MFFDCPKDWKEPAPKLCFVIKLIEEAAVLVLNVGAKRLPRQHPGVPYRTLCQHEWNGDGSKPRVQLFDQVPLQCMCARVGTLYRNCARQHKCKKSFCYHRPQERAPDEACHVPLRPSHYGIGQWSGDPHSPPLPPSPSATELTVRWYVRRPVHIDAVTVAELEQRIVRGLWRCQDRGRAADLVVDVKVHVPAVDHQRDEWVVQIDAEFLGAGECAEPDHVVRRPVLC